MAESAHYIKFEFLLYTVFGALSTILNIVEIILICRKRKTLKSYEQLLLSLSAGDFITGFAFSSIGVLHFSGVELVGNRDTISTGLLMVFLFSMDNLLIVGIDRLVAVRFPIRHRTWMTGNKMKFIIITIWAIRLLSIAVWLWFLHDQPKLLEYIFINLAPWLILSSAIAFTIIYTYLISTVVTRKHPTNQRKENTRQESTVIATCVSVVFIYVTCSCPAALEILISKRSTYRSNTFWVINAVLDPIVYFFKSYYDKKTERKTRTKLRLGMETIQS